MKRVDMFNAEYMELRTLARQIAQDSPVVMALEKYVLQIVSECAAHGRKRERERIANMLDGYRVPIDCTKLAKAIREDSISFPEIYTESADLIMVPRAWAERHGWFDV
jgi:hypothetical protein